jgi:hypothetical protein
MPEKEDERAVMLVYTDPYLALRERAAAQAATLRAVKNYAVHTKNQAIIEIIGELK